MEGLYEQPAFTIEHDKRVQESLWQSNGCGDRLWRLESERPPALFGANDEQGEDCSILFLTFVIVYFVSLLRMYAVILDI